MIPSFAVPLVSVTEIVFVGFVFTIIVAILEGTLPQLLVAIQ